MISLITISCIAAAFAPVISKRLKTDTVIAGGAGNLSEITSDCAQYGFPEECKLCTKEFCLSCEKTCASDQYAESKTCTCKKCSEHDKIKNSPLASKCIACNNSGCSACNNTGSDQGKYYIKDNLCENCGPSSNYYCDGINQYDKSKCEAAENSGYFCKNGIKRRCNDEFGTICSTCNASKCLSCGYGYRSDGNGNCVACINGCSSCTATKCLTCGGGYHAINTTTSYGVCQRCDSYIDNCKNCTSPIQTNTTCTVCFAGYYRTNNGKKCSPCSAIANCLYCTDAGVCTQCGSGYYLNKNNVCTKCNFANCIACAADGKCSACANGYNLSKDGTCQANDSQFRCADPNFMRVGKLCVTRRNMGDSSILSIPSTVVIGNSPKDGNSDYCTSINTKCCWKGYTVGDGSNEIWCNSKYSSYSGCTRTSCNYLAAEEICANFKYAGKAWRLPTREEIADWRYYSVGLGDNGLQLCEYNWVALALGSNNCGYGEPRCRGAGRWNRCYPHYHFIKGGSFNYVQGVIGVSGSVDYELAASVRCVTEMDDY